MWKQLKENELMVVRSDTKICKGCLKTFPTNLEHFGRGTVRKKENMSVIYLRNKCRSCFKPKTLPTAEQYRQHSMNYYFKNRDKINQKRVKANFIKKLETHTKKTIDSQKWKGVFSNVIKSI